MRADEIDTIRDQLDAFVQDIFGSLPRKDQRAKGGLYLQGLMLEGRRKSMQPMGERLGIDYQQLQQFVSTSAWPVEPVRARLAQRAIDAIDPDAWVVDDTGFVKDGPASPGVARQYSGSLGKIGNVQIGVTVHSVTDTASCPLNWRLFLPEAWDDTRSETNDHAQAVLDRRAKAQIPELVGHRPKWELAVEMLDELAVWGLVPPMVVSDAGFGECGPFRTALTDRGIDYVVQIRSTTTVYDATTACELVTNSRGTITAKYQHKPLQVAAYAAQLPAEAFAPVSWRHGSKGVMTSRFTARRVRPANRNLTKNPDGSLPACWLIIEWPTDAEAPTDYWLSTLPPDTPMTQLVRYGKIRWRIEHDYRELKHGLGLDHFEGRTWLGWHHHVTLVTAAHLFVTLQRLAADPKVHRAH